MELKTIIAAATLACVSMSMNAASHNTTLRHLYERDAQGRLTTRTAYAWNGDAWQPALRWTYTYTTTGYAVEFSRWNVRKGCFDAPASKTVYTFTPDATAAYVATYTRKDGSSAFQLTDSFLAAYPNKMPFDYIATNR